MIESDFESLKRGLAQVADYKAGARMGYAVHEPMNIKAIRAKTKLTQAAFAKKLHISAATLHDWEQGRRMPEGAARTLLGMVDADPDAAFKLLAKVVGQSGAFHRNPIPHPKDEDQRAIGTPFVG